MQNKLNVIKSYIELHKRQTLSYVVFVALIILALGGTYSYRKGHNLQKTNTVIKNETTAIEERSAPFTQKDLEKMDYKSYQLRLSVDANDYISSSHYSEAKRVLSEITNNVPKDKIISQTYRAYWYLYQKSGDTVNRKKYALLTAQQLKAEGQVEEAATFEQDSNGN